MSRASVGPAELALRTQNWGCGESEGKGRSHRNYGVHSASEAPGHQAIAAASQPEPQAESGAADSSDSSFPARMGSEGRITVWTSENFGIPVIFLNIFSGGKNATTLNIKCVSFFILF